MSAISLNMRKHYGPLLNGFYHIPFPDKYRGMFEQPNANTVEEYLAPLKECLRNMCQRMKWLV